MGFFAFMAKIGFNGQWIEIAKVGKFRDSKGVERDLTPTLLSDIVSNFNGGEDAAALTIGHPQHAAPAFGWVSELRMNGDRLEMKAEDTADEFESMVRDGRFRTRSAGIWLNHPSMKSPTIDHVAFLGAEPPAVKGLKQIQFSEQAEGERFALESPIIQLQEKKMEEKDFDQLPDSFWEKIKAKLGVKTELKEGGAVPQTTGVDADAVKSMIAEAVEATKAEFATQLGEKDKEIAKLAGKLDGQAAGSVKAEMAAFVESIPAEKGKHYLKRAGLAEFMESLATADAADGDKEPICFKEGDDEHKFTRVDWMKQLIGELPAMVQFGEKFGDIQASEGADQMVNLDRVKAMSDAAGVESKDGGAN